jgi:hypothetical protein
MAGRTTFPFTDGTWHRDYRRNQRARGAALQLIGVWEPRQNRIMSGWPQIFDDATKYRIEQIAGMHHIKVEWHELAIEMQLGFII